MMRADRVRHLCLCPVCGKLGDERRMVKAGPMECLAHDRCVFEQLGERILNLPKEERAKFTLAAVGPRMMWGLVDTPRFRNCGFAAGALAESAVLWKVR